MASPTGTILGSLPENKKINRFFITPELNWIITGIFMVIVELLMGNV
jgi:hypothetical protein